MKKIFILSVLLQSLGLSAQTTIYVNQNVQSGQQNGSSWADAFPDLQQALSASIDGNEIWVATGTYYPRFGTDRSILKITHHTDPPRTIENGGRPPAWTSDGS